MLQSMKKPDPKKRKLGKAQTVVAYERKSAPSTSTSQKAISKADAEANLGRMRKSFEDYQDEVEGEKTFGPEYKDLDLKPYKYKMMDIDGTNVQEKRGYRTKSTSGEKPDFREEIERVSPTQDILRIYRTKGGSGINYIPEGDLSGYGREIKKHITSDKRGNPAIVYEESIKQRAENNRAAYKARQQAKAKEIIDRAEADKAKAKAGGK